MYQSDKLGTPRSASINVLTLTRSGVWVLAVLLCIVTMPAEAPATRILHARTRAALHPVVVDDGLVIQDVTVVSPERQVPLPHATVVIRSGRIAQIGTGLVAGPHARRIDGSGRFLIPGLIDSHVHVGHSAALDDDAIDAHPELWTALSRAGSPRLSRVRVHFGRRSRHPAARSTLVSRNANASAFLLCRPRNQGGWRIWGVSSSAGIVAEFSESDL
jgi:hypothetical protein